MTIPDRLSQIKLEVWVYTQAQSGAGGDYQQVALLNSSGGLLFVPWQARENNPAWHQLVFDVSELSRAERVCEFRRQQRRRRRPHGDVRG